MNYNVSVSDKKRGSLIRYLRRKLGMTQADLAMKVGVSVNTVCDWEKGRKPSVKHWYLLCQELDMPTGLLDADLSEPNISWKEQVALLKQLPLSPEALETLEKALNLYYNEVEPVQDIPASGQPK